MNSAQRKAIQRMRQKQGFQEVRAFVNMPKFVKWLIWDGRLKEEDANDPAAIRKAHEDFLREHYQLMFEEPSRTEHNFQFARGSFGAEYTTIRDRPKEVVGLLERESEGEWRDPPTRFLITQRSAAIRKAVPPPEESGRRIDGSFQHDDQPTCRLPVEPTEGWPPPYKVPHYDYAEEAPEPHPDDYDPELNVEEESLDLSHEVLSEAFDVER
jgi:hypothetical protein